MLKYIYISATVIFAFCNGVSAQNWMDSADVRIEEIRKGNFGLEIKDELGDAYTGSVSVELIDHEFAWGGVIPIKDQPEYRWRRSIIERYCNFGVTGNYFKWPWIENEQGIVTYTEQDEVLEWAEKAGLGFRGHTLLWGGDGSWQMPKWTLDGSLTPQEIYAACENHITRDVSYWKGRIDEWDVINEPSDGHETWLEETVGDSVYWNSFKWAHAADSNTTLYVNDYNIIVWGSSVSYREKIQKMLDNGAPIGGIGVQAHMEGEVNWRDIVPKLDYMAELGLQIRVTEFDMKIDKFKVTEEQMAIDYATMLRIAFSHPSVSGLVLWSIWDKAAYQAGGGFYNEERIPKMAADSIYHLIREEWTTNLNEDIGLMSDTLSFRGFYGDYRVTVDFDGEMREFIVPCRAENADSVFVLEYAEGSAATSHLVEARVSKDADAIELSFSRPMDFGSLKTDDFVVYSMDDYSLESIEEIDSVTAQLNLQEATYSPGQFFGVFYDGDTAQTKQGGQLNHFGPEKAVNKLPAFKSAISDTLGESIRVVFSEKMEAGPSAAEFPVSVNGFVVSLSGLVVDEADSSVLIFNLGKAVEYGDELRISYSGDYRSAEGYLLQDFGPKFVLNTVPNPNQSTDLNGGNKESKIRVFPNPFSESLTFENIVGVYGIEIYSPEGKLLDKISTDSVDKIEINTANYPNGFLLARILDENNTTLDILKLSKK